MVTLLALHYAATQRIRVRARTRARLNYSERRARSCVSARSPHAAFTGQGLSRGIEAQSRTWAGD